MTALQQALSSSDIDQRGILEKADLAACVHDNFHRLPMAIRADVSALVEAPKKDLVRTDVLQALGARISRLQSDEQYSVRLFQVHLLSISGPAARRTASNLHRNNTDAYIRSPPLADTLRHGMQHHAGIVSNGASAEVHRGCGLFTPSAPVFLLWFSCSAPSCSFLLFPALPALLFPALVFLLSMQQRLPTPGMAPV